MLILAIDPGYERLGVAILEKAEGKENFLYSDCFKTSKDLPFSERLKEIGSEIRRVIKEFKPSALAIETLLFFKNQKTAMNVAEARGAIIYEAKQNELEVYEYTPLQIKIAVTGYGRSDKAQVIEMVKKLIKTSSSNKKTQDDEYDAIAIGLTCLASIRENLKIK